MSRKTRSAHGASVARDRFPLPDAGIPLGVRCFSMLIPDDDQLVQTFIGQIQALAWWFNWQRDAGKTGRWMSKYWYDLMQTIQIEDCETEGKKPVLDVRLRDCYLELRRAGSFHWENAGDIRNCDICDKCSDGTGGDVIDPESSQTTLEDCAWGGAVSLSNLIWDEIGTILDLIDAIPTVEEAFEDWREQGHGDVRQVAAWFETILTVFSIIASITTAIIRFLMDSEKQNQITCDIYCAILDGGLPYRYSGAVHESLISKWNVSFSEDAVIFLAKAALHYIIGQAYAAMYFRLGLDDCSDDWLILCPDCEDNAWCKNLQLVTVGTGFELFQGVWTSGEGIEGVWSTGSVPRVGYAQRIYGRILIPAATHISTVRIKYETGGIADDDGIGSGVQFGTVNTGLQTGLDEGIHNTVWDVDETTVDPTYLEFWAHYGFTENPAAPARFVFIREIEICGTGPDPFAE